jgi:hypothetical protein
MDTDSKARELISRCHDLAVESDRLGDSLDPQFARMYALHRDPARGRPLLLRHAARMLGRLMDPDLRRKPQENSPGQPFRERSSF